MPANDEIPPLPADQAEAVVTLINAFSMTMLHNMSASFHWCILTPGATQVATGGLAQTSELANFALAIFRGARQQYVPGHCRLCDVAMMAMNEAEKAMRAVLEANPAAKYEKEQKN
jgi:hypothetical protein